MGVGFLAILFSGAFYYALNQNVISFPIKREIVPFVSKEGAIVYRKTGFSPESLRIKKGTRVSFVNASQELFWPAVEFHPSHERYPQSSIEKCGTPEESFLFDSCRGIPPSSVYSFTFNEAGVWGYHDHLHPGHLGTIWVVE